MGVIVDTLNTMLPHRKFVVGIVVRVTRAPAQSPIQSQRFEPSPNSRVVSDEPLTEVGDFYHNYRVRSSHHFSFSPHVEDLMMHQCRLALRLYHPWWDGYSPSLVAGIDNCKLVGNYLQSQHIHDSLVEYGDSGYDTDTFKSSYLHNTDGCDSQLHWDIGGDKISTLV